MERTGFGPGTVDKRGLCTFNVDIDTQGEDAANTNETPLYPVQTYPGAFDLRDGDVAFYFKTDGGTNTHFGQRMSVTSTFMGLGGEEKTKTGDDTTRAKALLKSRIALAGVVVNPNNSTQGDIRYLFLFSYGGFIIVFSSL